MIHYRTFRNADPPGLRAAWNAIFTGRGAVRLDSTAWMEFFLFAKPYFNPQGLIIALADQQIVGFAWCGFGPNDTYSALDFTRGVVCLLGVVPSHRGQGIGSELLHRAENYLYSRGSKVLLAGPKYPLNPFTFGLYGGSHSPGFLNSDPLVRPFLEHKGYYVESSCLVFQRSLEPTLNVADGRFPLHRLHYKIHGNLFNEMTWWQECVFGPVELHEYRMAETYSGSIDARLWLWEMDPYVKSWQSHGIGITDVFVAQKLRRQGLAKFLLMQVLRFLQEQFYDLVEMQVAAENAAGINLLYGLGFEQIDIGHTYRKRP